MVFICKNCFARWREEGEEKRTECPICKNKKFEEAESMHEARKMTGRMRKRKIKDRR